MRNGATLCGKSDFPEHAYPQPRVLRLSKYHLDRDLLNSRFGCRHHYLMPNSRRKPVSSAKSICMISLVDYPMHPSLLKLLNKVEIGVVSNGAIVLKL